MFFPNHSTTELAKFTKIPLSTITKWKQKWVGENPEENWRSQIYDNLAMEMVIREQNRKFINKNWTKEELSVYKGLIGRWRDKYSFILMSSKKLLREELCEREAINPFFECHKDEERNKENIPTIIERNKIIIEKIVKTSPVDRMGMIKFFQEEEKRVSPPEGEAT